MPRRRHTPRPAPVVWLTSTAETLEHSSISRLTRELQDSRRFVFLETDGQQLRRRIHEFRPDNRLYLTIRLYGTAATHDLRVGKPGAFSLAMEGIRAAQLSGHLVCVHVVINAETKMPDIMALIHELGAFNLDGAVVTAATSTRPEPENIRQFVYAARSLLGNSWWAELSVDVELALGVSPRKILFAPDVRPSREDALSTDEVAAQ